MTARRRRMLLVEDGETNRLHAADLLKREGWEVDVAGDGARADRPGRRQGLLPVLDGRRLAEASETVRSQMVEMFAESARERIVVLAQAAAAGDTATVRTLAHTLKGASATIGARRMDQACDRLGKAAAWGRADEMSERQHDLEQAFALTDAALREYNREASNAG